MVALAASYTKFHGLNADAAKFRRQGSSIRVRRRAVVYRRWRRRGTPSGSSCRPRTRRPRAPNAATRQTPEAIAANRADWERRRADNGALLAGLSRALLVTFPLDTPRAAALLDVGKHVITTFPGDDFSDLRQRLSAYDVLGGIDIRARLRALGVPPGRQRLAELGPPQKTKKLNRQGRTLKITTALLVQSSCGISKPFGEEARQAEYVAKGDLTKLLRRLEADVKSLYALYEYGRLHGVVRLRWGFLEECIPAPWVHRDEPMLHDLEREALMLGAPLEVVVGSAPGWQDPWARARYAHVEPGGNAWQHWLVDDTGSIIDQLDVQRARLSTVH